MPLDLPSYRARVGSFCVCVFCTRAVLLAIHKLSFIFMYSIMHFLTLFFRGYPGFSIALLLFQFPVLQLAVSFQSNPMGTSVAVSYTHLTLPTTAEV